MNGRTIFVRVNACAWTVAAAGKALRLEVDIWFGCACFLCIWFLVAALKDE